MMPVENLTETAKETTKELHREPYLLDFIASRQWGTLGMLLEAVLRPKAALIQTYIEEGILVHTGLPWSIQALENAINNKTHESAGTQEMVGFIQGEIQKRVQDGFIILLPVEDAVQIFGENLKLSCITTLPHTRHQPCLILNLLEKPDEGIPGINSTNDTEITLWSMQFVLGKH